MKKILVVFLAVFSVSQLVGNNIQWSSPPTAISTSGLNGSDPHVAIDASGDVVAAWVENGTVVSRTKLHNINWGPTHTLSSTGASSPRLVMDSNGNATAIWLQTGIVYASTKTLNGEWTSATALSSATAASPALAVDSAGDVVAAWARNGNIETSIKLFGNIWQGHVQINSVGASSPQVAIGGTGTGAIAYIVWHGTPMGSTNDVVYASNRLLSGNWSNEMALSSASVNSAFADVAVDVNGNATAIWYQYNVSGSNYSNVYVQAASTMTSTSWTTPVSISAPGMYNPALLTARVACDGFGNMVALWNTSFDGETFNIESAVKQVGGNWSSPTDLVSFNTYGFEADMAVNAMSDALALYMFYNGSSLLIQSTESNINGFLSNVWAIPVNLSSGVDNGFPRVASSLTGNTINAAAVWVNSNGTNNPILASLGTRSVVAPPTSLSVMQHAINFNVFTDYANTISWTASTDSHVVGYVVFRNGIFVGEVASSETQFVDHNQVQNGMVTYGVAAVDNQQSQSNVASVTLP